MGYDGTTPDPTDAATAGLFALPAMMITLRETLEAGVIVSVLLGLLEKLDLPHLRKYVWYGVLLGTAISVALAVAVLLAVQLAKDALLDDKSTKLLEGAMSLIAAVLIGYVAVTIGNIMVLHAKVEAKLGASLENGEESISKKTIFLLSITTVLREGIETVVFFTAIGSVYSPESLPIPALVGAVIGIVASVLLYRVGGQMSVRIFFRATMVLIVFIGAGVFTNGVRSLWNAGMTENDPRLNNGLYAVLWDVADCCGLDKSEFWVLMHILFGYHPTPTALDTMMYLFYHAFIWGVLLFRTVRADRAAKQLRDENSAKATQISDSESQAEVA